MYLYDNNTMTDGTYARVYEIIARTCKSPRTQYFSYDVIKKTKIVRAQQVKRAIVRLYVRMVCKRVIRRIKYRTWA